MALLEIKEFFRLIFDMFTKLFNVLNSIVFVINGLRVSFGAMIFAFLVLGLVITVFWKGART